MVLRGGGEECSLPADDDTIHRAEADDGGGADGGEEGDVVVEGVATRQAHEGGVTAPEPRHQWRRPLDHGRGQGRSR